MDLEVLLRIHIYKYLDIRDYINLLRTCKKYYQNYNYDMIYEELLIKTYPQFFKIIKRNKYNYKNAYIFLKISQINNLDLWNEKDFYIHKI